MKIRAPRSLEAATALLERFAAIEAEIAGREVERAAALAQVNATADVVVLPLVETRDALLDALEPWWAASAAELTNGKRKSIELGGCQIGTRAGAAKFAFPGDDTAALAALAQAKFRKQVTTVKTSIDKKAIVKLLTGNGAIATALKALGFSAPTSETFFVARIDSADAKVSSR